MSIVFLLRFPVSAGRPIGVNRAGNPAFDLFPRNPAFCENIPHFYLYFKKDKILVFQITRHYIFLTM